MSEAPLQSGVHAAVTSETLQMALRSDLMTQSWTGPPRKKGLQDPIITNDWTKSQRRVVHQI